MKRLTLRHESGYYWGLVLLFLSCLPLVWALWRDAFQPQVFLVGLLTFSWGWALLWRYDLNERLHALEGEIQELKIQLKSLTAPPEVPVEIEEVQEIQEENEQEAPENEGDEELALPTEF